MQNKLKSTFNDNKNVFGEFRVEVSDVLKVSATKKGRQKIIFLLIFVPLSYFSLLAWLLLLLKKNLSVFVSICGLAMLILISLFLLLSFLKYYKNLYGVVLEKKDFIIYLNNRKLCNDNDLKGVIIQPKADFSPVSGVSSSIGLKLRDKEIPIFFEYSTIYINGIAELIAEYLDRPIIEKKIIVFGLFSKW